MATQLNPGLADAPAVSRALRTLPREGLAKVLDEMLADDVLRGVLVDALERAESARLWQERRDEETIPLEDLASDLGIELKA